MIPLDFPVLPDVAVNAVVMVAPNEGGRAKDIVVRVSLVDSAEQQILRIDGGVSK